MKRLLFALALGATAVGANVMPVGAAVWCHDDPNVPVALPVTYSVESTTTVQVGRHWVYAWALADGSSYQHAEATVGAG